MKEFDLKHFIVNPHSKKDILDKIEEMKKINTYTESVIKKLQEMLEKIEEEETIFEKERKIYNFLKRNQDHTIEFIIDWGIEISNYHLTPGLYKLEKDENNRWNMIYSDPKESFVVSLLQIKKLKINYD